MAIPYARKLFVSAACFNLMAGLPSLLFMERSAGPLGLQLTPTAILFMQVSAGIVLIFGWAYWRISVDPVYYRPYILLGIIAKLLFVVVYWGHWLVGNIPWPLPALVVGDLIFAALFFRYYRQSAKSP